MTLLRAMAVVSRTSKMAGFKNVPPRLHDANADCLKSTKQKPQGSFKMKTRKVARNVIVKNERSKNSKKFVSSKQVVEKNVKRVVDKPDILADHCKRKAEELLESHREKVLVLTNPSHVVKDEDDEGAWASLKIPISSTLLKSGDTSRSEKINPPTLPSRALHVSMVKHRFADLINKYNPREQDKKQDAQSRNRGEGRLKSKAVAVSKNLQRQKDREAARKALELMKKTVVIYDNATLTKDLMSFGLVINHDGYLEDV